MQPLNCKTSRNDNSVAYTSTGSPLTHATSSNRGALHKHMLSLDRSTLYAFIEHCVRVSNRNPMWIEFIYWLLGRRGNIHKSQCAVFQNGATPTTTGKLGCLFTELDRQITLVWCIMAEFTGCQTANYNRVDSKDCQFLSLDRYRSRQHDKDLGTGRR